MRVNHEFIGKILSSPGSANTKKNPMSPRAAATPRISTANGTAATTPRSVKKIYNATGPLLINNSKEKKELSFFNLLYTEMGFKNCQKYFTDESMNTKGTFTENQFIHFMRELTDLGDHQIVEIFDIFGLDFFQFISFYFSSFIFLVFYFSFSQCSTIITKPYHRKYTFANFKDDKKTMKTLERLDFNPFSCYFP